MLATLIGQLHLAETPAACASSQSSLHPRLPIKIIQLVLFHLPGKDLKNARLTSTAVCDLATPLLCEEIVVDHLRHRLDGIRDVLGKSSKIAGSVKCLVYDTRFVSSYPHDTTVSSKMCHYDDYRARRRLRFVVFLKAAYLPRLAKQVPPGTFLLTQ